MASSGLFSFQLLQKYILNIKKKVEVKPGNGSEPSRQWVGFGRDAGLEVCLSH